MREFKRIESIIALIKPETNLIKEEFADSHHSHESGEPEKDSKTLEKKQKISEPEEKAATLGKEPDKTSYSCLCAAPGCDFMSDEISQEQKMREHFYSAHEELTFANDSFIWLNPDMAILIGMDF